MAFVWQTPSRAGTWLCDVSRAILDPLFAGLHLFSHSGTGPGTRQTPPHPEAPTRARITPSPRADQSTKRIINKDCHIKNQNRKQQNWLANEITWRSPEVLCFFFFVCYFVYCLLLWPLVWLLIMATAATPTINFRYIYIYVHIYRCTGIHRYICIVYIYTGMYAGGGEGRLARLHIHGSSHY